MPNTSTTITIQDKVALIESFGISTETNLLGNIASVAATERTEYVNRNGDVKVRPSMRLVSGRAVDLFSSLSELNDAQRENIPHYAGSGHISLRVLAGLETADVSDTDRLSTARRELVKAGMRSTTARLLKELTSIGLIRIEKLPRTEFPKKGERAPSCTRIVVATDGVLFEGNPSTRALLVQDPNDPFLHPAA